MLPPGASEDSPLAPRPGEPVSAELLRASLEALAQRLEQSLGVRLDRLLECEKLRSSSPRASDGAISTLLNTPTEAPSARSSMDLSRKLSVTEEDAEDGEALFGLRGDLHALSSFVFTIRLSFQLRSSP